MTKPFHEYCERLVGFIRRCSSETSDSRSPLSGGDSEFNRLALTLFSLQFEHVEPCRRFCRNRGIKPQMLSDWSRIPAMPAIAFKETELTSLPPEKRTNVFHSSGTTEQMPSRHFHDAGSLGVYESSALPWFQRHVLHGARRKLCFIILTPSPALAPHSSLVHMLETARRECGSTDSLFTGRIDATGNWTLQVDATLAALRDATETNQPVVLPGTAFAFVHLLDHLIANNVRLQLPSGSRVMETGGYKGRSRSLPKHELHSLIVDRLGISSERIVCEYGMSELSSQAYDCVADHDTPAGARAFAFPPWARVQIVSPETGREVAEGETGLIRVFDLANVCSIMAVQTEDLAVRRGDRFELIGRTPDAQPRGCSLMHL